MSLGKYGFSLNILRESFPLHTETALISALKRLSSKGKVVSIYKGYYLIIPPQYSGKGILPPYLFLDDLMNYIGRQYYVGLLSAAAFHAASHQQPQETFVITTFPVLRATNKKGIKINYLSVRRFPEELIEKRKTETGYLNISGPCLTATDLIQFEKRIGGLSRAATVLYELSEVLTPACFNETLMKKTPVTTLQRLGYLLEFACDRQELSDALYEGMLMQKIKFYRIPLKASGMTTGFSSRNRWKIIENTQIDIDL